MVIVTGTRPVWGSWATVGRPLVREEDYCWEPGGCKVWRVAIMGLGSCPFKVGGGASVEDENRDFWTSLALSEAAVSEFEGKEVDMRGFGLRHRGIHIGERERCSEKRRRRKSMEKNGQCGF